MSNKLQTLTLLPAQVEALVRVTDLTDAAISVTQDGSTLHISTGNDNFAINAQGKRIARPAPKWPTGE